MSSYVKYYKLSEVLTDDNGASLLARFCTDANRLVINGRVYSIFNNYYNTQCGGKVLQISPQNYDITEKHMDVETGELPWADDEHKEVARSRGASPSALFVHSDCGITQVSIWGAHPHDVPWFHKWYLSIEADLADRMDHRTSCSEVIGIHYRKEDNTIPMEWTFHAADEVSHEDGCCDEGEYGEDDRDCPQCDYEYVRNDGYCAECDEYVLDECYWSEDYQEPAAQTDDSDLSCKESDYVKHDGLFDIAYLQGRMSSPGVLYFDCDRSGAKGLVCNIELSPRGDTGKIATKDTAMNVLLREISDMLVSGPVYMSCNMGDSWSATGWYIEQLQVRADEIKREFGVEVTSPSDYATNPNMNYHYIDSLTLSVVNFDKFQEAVCPTEE